MVVLAIVPGFAQIALQSGAPNFGVQSVGSSQTATLTFAFDASVTVGAPEVVTQGYTGQDFTTASATCVARAYSTGQTCTVGVTFTPKYPGQRAGAVVFKDNGGTVIATTYIQGVGDGALQAISPVSSEAGLSFRPMGLAVDAGGYIYVVDPGASYGNGKVWKIAPDLTGVALAASDFYAPVAVALDGAGNLYVADSGCNCVWKVTGGEAKNYSSGLFLDPMGIAVDGFGSLYISDYTTQSIWAIRPDGTKVQVADSFSHVGAIALDARGNIYLADNQPSYAAYVWKVTPGSAPAQVWSGVTGGGKAVSSALGLAVDGVGDVYIVDSFTNLWMLTPGGAQMLLDTGITSWAPKQIAVDGQGNAYLTDVANNAVVKLGGASFFKANGACGSVNGGAFTAVPTANLCRSGVSSKVDSAAGSWSWSCSGVNSGSTASCSAFSAAAFKFVTPPASLLPVGGNAGTVKVAILDGSGSVVTGSTEYVTLSVTGPNGYSQSYSANAVNGYANFDLSATALSTDGVYTYAVSSSGLAAQKVSETVVAGRHSQTGIISTLAGTGISGYNGDDIPATSAWLNTPYGTALDTAGNIYIADSGNHRVRVICVASSGAFCAGRTVGNIYTVAGNGTLTGYSYVDNVDATSVSLRVPVSVALDGAGNLYIADDYEALVLKVDATTHTIARFAGSWSSSNVCSAKTNKVGDGCPATSAILSQDIGIAVGAGGDVLIADGGANGWSLSSGHHLVRVVCAASTGPYCAGHTAGNIYSLAGCSTIFDGNSCAGTQNENLLIGSSVALDNTGTIYFNNYGTGLVRKVDPTTGIYSLVAGGGTNHCNGAETDRFGDGCPATSVMFYGSDIALDGWNSLYVSDAWGIGKGDGSGDMIRIGLIREVDATTQILTTAAGTWLDLWSPIGCTGATNQIGDGCIATNARIGGTPSGLTLDPLANIYFADTLNNRIRKIGTWLQVPSFTGLSSPSVVYGSSVTLSGQIAAGSTQPHDGETVTITINGVALTALTSNGSYSAVFDTKTLPASAATYTVTYDYPGDDALASASDSSTKLVVGATSVALVSSANPSNVGDNLTFTAIVQPAGATGTVEFYDNGATLLGSAALDSNGNGSFSTSYLTVGAHSITAVYAGEGAFGASTSAALNQVVQAPALSATTTTLQSSANPSGLNAPVTFTATVTGALGDVPWGPVTFMDGNTELATVSGQTGDGQTTVTTFTTSALSFGFHNITATFAGSRRYAASASAVLVQEVRNGTTLSLTSSANPAHLTSPITFTATVVSPAGTPSGSVDFVADGNTVTVALNNAGVAEFTSATLGLGPHLVTANYTGVPTYVPSSSSLKQGVITESTVTLTSESSPSPSASVVKFTATVSSSLGTPYGEVRFKDGAVLIGTATLDKSGAAILRTNSLTPGTHSITAIYAGSYSHAGSSSNAVQQVIGKGATGTLLEMTAQNPWEFATALLSTAGGAPTGGMNLNDGSFSLAGTSLGSPERGFSSGGFNLGSCGDANQNTCPEAIVAADLNGDGQPDVVVADAVNNVVSVALRNPDGTFGPKTDYAMGFETYAAVAADVNNDGIPDIVVGGWGNAVLLGNGDGTFTQGPVTPYFGIAEVGMTVADLDGDGNLDVATVNYQYNRVAVSLGNGDGSFQPLVRYSVDYSPQAIAAADFNGDGKLDLVVSNSCGNDSNCNGNGTVTILLGNGDGTFQPQTRYDSGMDSPFMVVGDFNHDNNPDVAVANFCTDYTVRQAGCTNAGAISILLGNGDGTLAAAVAYPTAPGARRIVAADFDGDGNLDLATANEIGQNVSVLFGNPDGTFQPRIDVAIGKILWTIAAADLDGGGRADLLVPSHDGYLTVLLSILQMKQQFQINTLATGSHNMTASYAGDANYAASSSAVVVAQASNMAPNIGITQTADNAAVTTGNQIGFQIYAANMNSVNGTGPATGVTVSDPLPAGPGISWTVAPGMQGASCSISGQAGSQSLSCSFGTLAAGTAAGLHIISATDASSAGTYTNTATISATNAAKPAHAAATIVVQGGLAITATPQTMTYGGSVPSLTYSISPNLPLDTSPTCVSAANSSSPAGSYPGAIVCSGASKTNYSISYVDGKMEVLRANLTASAYDKQRSYGSANPLLDGSFTGVVTGDGITVSYSTVATVGSPIGRYSITPVLQDLKGKLANYTVNSTNGVLTVTPAALTVTANNLSMFQGGTVPALTYATTGFMNSEGLTVLTGAPQLATAVTAATPAGTYPITISAGTLAAANYTFSFANGTLSVLPVPVITSLSPVVMTAGSKDISVTVNGTGFQSGATVRLNGTAHASTFVSSLRLTALVTTADLANIGIARVTVLNPDGGLSNPISIAIDSTSPVKVSANNANLQLSAGQKATMLVSFEGISSTAQVTATCENLPAGGHCAYDHPTRIVTFDTSDVTPKGTYQVIVIFTVTQLQTVAASSHPLPNFAMLSGGICLPFGLMLVGGSGRKALRRRALLVLAFVVLLLIPGCGGRSQSSSTTLTTQTSLPITLSVN